MFHQLVFCKNITGQLHLGQRLAVSNMMIMMFYQVTEEPIEVLKIAASIPRNKPSTPSALKIVESASKEFL